jgi:methyl coenzyme M reductase subunit C-like uncharacterized protein (methanogenesis marker protein 7)
MLQMRARGFALRDAFADAMRGFKSTEELSDYPDAQPGNIVNVVHELPEKKTQEISEKEQPKLVSPHTVMEEIECASTEEELLNVALKFSLQEQPKEFRDQIRPLYNKRLSYLRDIAANDGDTFYDDVQDKEEDQEN